MLRVFSAVLTAALAMALAVVPASAQGRTQVETGISSDLGIRDLEEYRGRYLRERGGSSAEVPTVPMRLDRHDHHEDETAREEGQAVIAQAQLCVWDPLWLHQYLDFRETGARGSTECTPATWQAIRTSVERRNIFFVWVEDAVLWWPNTGTPTFTTIYNYNTHGVPYFSLPHNSLYRIRQEYWFSVSGSLGHRATSTSPTIDCTSGSCTW